MLDGEVAEPASSAAAVTLPFTTRGAAEQAETRVMPMADYELVMFVSRFLSI